MTSLRYALRQLLKDPGFTLVAVLTLAIGIGANTAAFSWIQSVLLRSIPGVKEPDRLVVLAPRHVTGELIDTMSYVDIRDLAGHQELFDGIVGTQYTPMSLALSAQPEWVWGQIATANFFDVLGVRAALGRTFLPEEETKPGGHAVVVISHAYWQRRFAGDPGVIGKVITLNRHAFTIVGVAERGFRGTMGGLAFDLWAPLMMREQLLPGGADPAFFQARGSRWLHTVARLRSGTSAAQVQTAVDVIARQWEKEYPTSNRNIRFVPIPLWKSPWGAPGVLAPLLSVLFAVTVLVLLIVAANIANLLLARATGREREMSVRMALGASRGRLIRQLLIESLVLAMLGAAVGVPCALWLTDLTRHLFPIVFLPVVLDPQLDWGGLLFMVCAALGTGLVFGLAPAWQSTRPNLCHGLKDGGRTGSAGRHRLRSVLVASEIALALLLLIGAGLCHQSFSYAQSMNRGFVSDHVLLANLRLGVQAYSEADGRLFYRRVLERARTISGVQAACLADYVPLGPEGGSSARISVEGYVPQPTEQMSFPFNTVSPGYFQTLQIPLREGREFEPRDDTAAPRVAIINETLARRFWPGQSPVGRRFTFFGTVTATVIGVAKDGKYRHLNEPATGFFYMPLEQQYTPNMNLHLRVPGNPLSFSEAVQREVRALDPAIQPAITVPLNDVTDFAYLTHRIAAAVLTVLGVSALVLAMMGTYGVMAFTAGQRTQEIGIRMALGAGKPDVMKLLLGQGARLAAWGVAGGLVGALAVTRLLSSLLIGVSAIDPLTFGLASLILGATVLLACWLPARRATNVDPVEALRWE